MSDLDEKTQRLVNLLKQRDSMLKAEKKRKAAFKEDFDDVEDGIKELAAELDEGEKETIDLA